MSNFETVAAAGAVPTPAIAADPVRRCAEILPRPLRFLAVGGLGLIADLAMFTLLVGHGLHPLLARLVSLAVATLVTWRLNRALTFARSGRCQSAEAIRYAAVAATAQTVSYAVFAVFVLTIPAAWPQFAVLIGAAAGAIVSYKGQALFAFRPHAPAASPQGPA